MRIAKRSRFPGGWTICALSGLALTACGRGGGASSHSISSAPTAAPTTSVGSSSPVGPSGTAGPEPFVSPVGVAVDTLGNVYVADYGNDQVRRITPTGVVTTVAGSRKAGDADGTGTTASFHFPEGVALDSAGNVYVADWGASRILELSATGELRVALGGPGTALGQFDSPEGLCVDSQGHLFVADTGNNRVQTFAP